MCLPCILDPISSQVQFGELLKSGWLRGRGQSIREKERTRSLHTGTES